MLALIKAIGLFIVFSFKFSIYIVLLIYKIIVFLCKTIIFLLNNKFTRIPCILFLLGILFRINFNILSTIYYIYLLHSFFVRNRVYINIRNNLIKYFTNIKEMLDIKKLFRLLPTNNVIFTNILLDTDDTILNIYYLAITPKGLFNIVPLSNYLSFNDDDTDTTLYKIYNETEVTKNILAEIIDDEIPLTTLILSDNKLESSLNSDYFKLIEKHQLPYIINSHSKYHKSIDTFKIKEIILENKAWLLDKLTLDFLTFIKKNIKTLLFLLFCPLIYCFYLIIILTISNCVILLKEALINLIHNLF